VTPIGSIDGSFVSRECPTRSTGTVSARALLALNPDGSCSLMQVPRLEVDKFAESGTLSF
jgi:hypothetical protein